MTNNLSLEEMEQETATLTAKWLALFLLSHFPFSLKLFAQILSDDQENVSYATIRNWVVKFRLKPSLKVEGLRRPVWGFSDLAKFVLVRRLLRENRLPVAAVAKFLASWMNRNAVPVFSGEEDGVLVILGDGSVKLFKDYDASFLDYCRELSKAGTPFISTQLSQTIKETHSRVVCWSLGTKFHAATKGEFVKALRSAGHLRDEVNSAEEALKS